MKISKVSIKNYRSCQNTTFVPDENLSVFIGPNGSGKTNALSALRLLPALVRNPSHRFEQPDLSATPCELKITFSSEIGKVTYEAKIYIVTNEKNQDEIIHAEESWWLPSITGRQKKVGIPSAILRELSTAGIGASVWGIRSKNARTDLIDWLNEREVTTLAFDLLLEVIKFFTKITYYSASQFTNPGSAPVSFEVESELKNRIGISLTGHKRLLFEIYQEYRSKTNAYHQFLHLIGRDGIGLIDDIIFDEIETSSSSYSVMTGGKVVRKEKKNLLIVPRIKIGHDTLSPSQLSEGSFKTFALIFYIVRDESALLMIEEPEVCIHHGLLSSIIELIKIYSNEKQIIISTHSDAVLDKLKINNVFIVKKEEKKGTTINNIQKSLSSKEITALKKYLNEDGSLGEYWRHGDLENN